MTAAQNTLDRPVQEAIERGKRTLENVLRRFRARDLGTLQTTTNEVSFLAEAARLAAVSGAGAREPAEGTLEQAQLRGIARVAELRQMAGPCLETGQVCALLGVSRETIRKKVDRKQLLALPKGNEDRVFPAFQFKEGKVRPGIKEVLQAMNSDTPFEVLAFLFARSPFFGNKTALEALQADMIDEVVAEASGLFEHGS
jgi:hypothetical protein